MALVCRSRVRLLQSIFFYNKLYREFNRIKDRFIELKANQSEVIVA